MYTQGIFENSDSDYQSFFGRKEELELLEKAILIRKDRIVAISGNNATGKTCLWRAFIRMHKTELKNKIEVVTLPRYHEDFSRVGNEIDLIIIEDLSFDYTLGQDEKISKFISNYPEKQFILVGVFPDFLKKFKPQQHVHLSVLPSGDSIQLLLNALSNKIPEKDLVRITSLTKGNPFLLKLVAQYLNDNLYSLDEMFRLITESIQYKSFSNQKEKIITELTPKFVHVSNDIRIVNKSILERIKYNPNAIHGLTPRQFEEMVAELMIKRGYEVDLTKATRDGGKDLIIANHADIGNFMYYVECKKYAPTNPVGVNLVRELAGTISADRVTAGIMITSSYYSPDAVEFSENFRHQISLIDFIKLKEWMKECS
ncbi:restriction endonuclease [Shewanella baltica]|uniref:restriction endonuclease n=1 Tax=Shewanella baltica TaxID=62322 RepID=UPI00217E4764|nr:restriction endonuclease [Shewanella baltica]MCS6236236.1 restriction endonuclease [Shewanella baltica]MCS6270651.1 restriction endonuclease [Shewanella baltica]